VTAREYYLALQHIVHASVLVLRSDMRLEEIDTNECYTMAFSGSWVDLNCISRNMSLLLLH
jgi:hypothetical protein